MLIHHRYVSAKPTLFRIGDVVEVQLSFIVHPLSHGKRFKMFPTLRSIALLDRSPSQVCLVFFSFLDIIADYSTSWQRRQSKKRIRSLSPPSEKHSNAQLGMKSWTIKWRKQHVNIRKCDLMRIAPDQWTLCDTSQLDYME